METSALLLKLNKLLPGAVLENQRFGKSDAACIWIEKGSMREVAAILMAEWGFDWLENLSVAQLDDAMILTYFLRSNQHRGQIIVRCSYPNPSFDEEVEAPSVCTVWQMAIPMEAEISELQGIRFREPDGALRPITRSRLPEGWQGFPLRKEYAFPKEWYGISHTRGREHPRRRDAASVAGFDGPDFPAGPDDSGEGQSR